MNAQSQFFWLEPGSIAGGCCERDQLLSPFISPFSAFTPSQARYGNHDSTMIFVFTSCLLYARKIDYNSTGHNSTVYNPTARILPVITQLARTQLLTIQLDMSTMLTTRLARTQLASTLPDTTNPPHATHQNSISRQEFATLTDLASLAC